MKIVYDIDTTKTLKEISDNVLEKLEEVAERNIIISYGVSIKDGLFIEAISKEAELVKPDYYKITLQHIKNDVDDTERPLDNNDWSEGESWIVDANDINEKADVELKDIVKKLLKRC